MLQAGPSWLVGHFLKKNSGLDTRGQNAALEIYVADSQSMSLKLLLLYTVGRFLFFVIYVSGHVSRALNTLPAGPRAMGGTFRYIAGQSVLLVFCMSLLCFARRPGKRYLAGHRLRLCLCLPSLLGTAITIMHMESVRYTLDGRPRSHIPRCFDVNTFQALSFELIMHVGIILPSELACVLVLPLMLVIFIPTYAICGSALMFSRHNSACLTSGSTHPSVLVALLFVSVIANLTKGFSQLQLAKQLALTSREVVAEKVKRCEAEFQVEIIRASEERTLGVTVAAPASEVVSKTTLLTAPAQLFSVDRNDEMCVALHDNADCLPEHCTVQTEGSDVPVEVRSLTTDDKILCYDHLLQTAVFRKVVNVEANDASPSEWLRVELTDGTFMDVTSDHPMKATTLNGASSLPGATTMAQNLKAQQHALTCIRPVQLGIKDIKTHEASPELGAARRISISVWQGERHSIFANLPGSTPSRLGAVAVGSADAASREFYTKHNTVHARAAPQQVPRSKSDTNVNYVQAWGHQYRSELQSRTHELSSITTSSVSEVVSTVRFPQATLTGHLELKQSGLASAGSAQHGADCTPCKYQIRHLAFNPEKANGRSRPPACSHGVYCSFCHHEEHAKEGRYPPRAGKNRAKKQL